MQESLVPICCYPCGLADSGEAEAAPPKRRRTRGRSAPALQWCHGGAGNCGPGVRATRLS
eukprot:5465625-Alexandrium_andersonii.AAC.2